MKDIKKMANLSDLLQKKRSLSSYYTKKEMDLHLLIQENEIVPPSETTPIALSYSVAQVCKNTAQTCEDTYCYHTTQEGDVLAGVFDGHITGDVSNYLQKHYATEFQKQRKLHSDSIFCTFEETTKALKKNIEDPSNQLSGGSTANVSFIQKNGKIYTATLGDSVTIILRQDEKGQWQWIPLSTNYDWKSNKDFQKLVTLHALHHLLNHPKKEQETEERWKTRIVGTCQNLVTLYNKIPGKELRCWGERSSDSGWKIDGINVSRSFETDPKILKMHGHTLVSQKTPITKAQLQKRDLLLIITDGVFDYSFIHEIIAHIQANYRPEGKKNLASLVLEKVEPGDDATVQAFEVQ